MTTHIELLEIINNGENSGVEFKRDVIENRALAKELVAFSNLSGGMVLLGVEDDGTMSGITRDRSRRVGDDHLPGQNPAGIIPFFEIVRDVEPGKDVAIVSVTPGYNVHSVWHNNRNTYYIRVGTQSREPNPGRAGPALSAARHFPRRAAAGFWRATRPISIRRLRDYFERIAADMPAEER